MLFTTIRPVVRRVLVLCLVAVAASVSVFRGGIVTNVFVELALIVFLYNLPYLLNRAQHISLRSHGSDSADLEAVRDPTSLRAISYNLFMRPGIAWIKNNERGDFKDVRLAAFLRHLESFDIFFFLELYFINQSQPHQHRFDIINLQEMFGLLSFRQRRLIAEAEKKGFVHAAVAGAPTYLFWDKHWSFK